MGVKMTEVREDTSALIYVTNQCNSNCIMCPDSVKLRTRPNEITLENLKEQISGIDPAVEHVDITGGVPTLLREKLPVLIEEVFRQAPDAFPKVLRYLVIALSIILFLLLQWVFPLQSHFVNTVKTTFKNSALMAIANFPRTLGIGGIWLVSAGLAVLSVLALPQIFPFVVLFGLSVPGYVTCLLVSKPFSKFEPEKVELTEEESEEEKEEAFRILNESR